MKRILDIYLYNEFVGILTQDESGELEFAYDDNYLSKGTYGLSLSLPPGGRFSNSFSNDFFKGTYKGSKVEAFFSGLLPEESLRLDLAKYLGLSYNNSFALLEAIGGDCAGALSAYPPGKEPSVSPNEFEVLDNKGLLKILETIKQRPMLAGEDGYRLSLAGAQNKLAVGYKDGQVLLIKGGFPTTHILKPGIERFKDSVYNEIFCMKLAKFINIDVPEVSLHFVENIPCFLVERFDRKIDATGNITRIHQEDFCQAFGIIPNFKYQREGGPDIAKCLELIAQNFARPADDQIKFLNIIIFNYLIGNSDAHGKNFSLLYIGNKPELAPAYDLLSIEIYPNIDQKMAMKIGGKYRPQDVYLRHFHRLVPETKTAQNALNNQINTMTSKIMDAAVRLKSEFEQEGITSEVFDKIIKVIKFRIKLMSRT